VAREAQTGLSRRLFIQPDAGEEDSSEDKGKSKEVEVINNCYGIYVSHEQLETQLTNVLTRCLVSSTLV
jgi:hypothetical protein